jgi:hypothetical protein
MQSYSSKSNRSRRFLANSIDRAFDHSSCAATRIGRRSNEGRSGRRPFGIVRRSLEGLIYNTVRLLPSIHA